MRIIKICEVSIWFQIYKNSHSTWEGDNEIIQSDRIYGISFPSSKSLKEWNHYHEEAKKRNHKLIGKIFFITNNISYINDNFALYVYDHLVITLSSQRKKGIQVLLFKSSDLFDLRHIFENLNINGDKINRMSPLKIKGNHF